MLHCSRLSVVIRIACLHVPNFTQKNEEYQIFKNLTELIYEMLTNRDNLV